MVQACYKKYESYEDFVKELLISAMQESSVAIICNYKDYQGLISSLNEKVMNGNSLYLNHDSLDSFDSDIAFAQANDGNMMITISNTGEIIGEPVIYQTTEAFAPITYFVECDAEGALEYPINGMKIPFKITGQIV